MTANDMRNLAVDYMRQRQRKISYTQGDRRVYFFGFPDNRPGDTTQPGYSDCSSSVRAAIKAAAGIDIGYNTDAQIRNRGRGMIVEEPNGVPTASKLLPGDCLYFRGNKAHIMEVGHVEMYAGGGKLRGHGGGMGPYESDMATYCKRRPCFMVIRWILGDNDAPDPAPQRPTLRRGDCGDDVRDMQLMLIDQDYSCGRWGADGEFGRDTENALKLYQAEHDLEPDGICGPLTWAALESWAAGDTDPTEPELGYVTVRAGTWRVRSGPGTQYGTIAFVRAGDKLRRNGEAESGWLGVRYDFGLNEWVDAWISGKAVEG